MDDSGVCAQKRTRSSRLWLVNQPKRQTAGLERACIGLGLTLKFADGIESKHKGMLETVNMLRKRKTMGRARRDFYSGQPSAYVIVTWCSV